MPDAADQPVNPQDRRTFFRQGFSQLLRPVAGYLEQRLNLPEPRVLLRPPGARPEKEFVETCYRCGNCADVCPANAIKLHPGPEENVVGTPIIDADLAACVVCDDIACTKACPSGALLPLSEPGEIRMGLAIVDQRRCLRAEGEDCRECLEKCPIGEVAIQLDSKGRIEVFSEGCVGCGVCQMYCPTTPKSIVVDPI